MCRDELVGDFVEKHWIETPIFKLIYFYIDYVDFIMKKINI